jgi:hypothetical protein
LALQPGNHHPPSAELRQLHDELRPARDELRPARDELRPARDELRPARDELPARDDFLGRCASCAGNVVARDEFIWLSGDLFHVDCVEQPEKETTGSESGGGIDDPAAGRRWAAHKPQRARRSVVSQRR